MSTPRKPCLRCHRPKPAGRGHRYCPPCRSVQAEEYRAKQREGGRRIHAANAQAINRARAMRRYGLGVADYERLLAVQGGVCAVCGMAPTKRRLAVDHDHETGEVRGLLCQRCNALVDVAVRLREAIDEYLAAPPAQGCPESILAEAAFDEATKVAS